MGKRNLLALLLSETGVASEAAYRKVVARCLAHPELLSEVVVGLHSPDPALIDRCAAVLTQVALPHPEWVAPYAELLTGLLSNPYPHIRAEALQALALVAPSAPKPITAVLARLAEIMRSDPSFTVRNAAVGVIASYATSGSPAAVRAYPLLKKALALRTGKHAARALQGLATVALLAPGLAAEIRGLAQSYLDDRRRGVHKAAQAVLIAERDPAYTP